jgi:hypothetical protein
METCSDKIRQLLRTRREWMTASEIAHEIGQSYGHVSKTLREMYWKKPYPMCRWLTAGEYGRVVRYRWRNHSSG